MELDQSREDTDMPDEQKAHSDDWSEVGEQFRLLGASLATAVRSAWESEENRQNVQNLRNGLEGVVKQIDDAFREFRTTPEAQDISGEVQRAAKSAHLAGEHAWRKAQPHVLSALRQVNAEIREIVAELEKRQTGSS
jgi:hypothetical protein